MKKWIKSTWSVILAFLVVIGICFWLSYSNAVFWKDQQLANASTVTFTMLLAGATILLAFFTYLSVKSGYDREKRDRKEGFLNEIVAWATSIKRLDTYLINLTESVRLDINTFSMQNIKQLSYDLEDIINRSEYIKIILNVVCNKSNDSATILVRELNNISTLLGNFIILNDINGDAEYLITTEDAMLNDRDVSKDTIERHRKNIGTLCNSIIKEATEIKTKDIV
jgi:hypothetical protein